MNTALHASPPTESKHSAHPERELSIRLPREEELRHLSLVERVALRIALRLIVRAGSAANPAERAQRAAECARVRAEHVAQLLRHYVPRQML
ncbi:hypothetical protein [Microbacterium panaciterrae]|uniref:Uncharacterized protein n=1 Tax=Microbacterium panaciterrae TaxID=985759 RepID=A0ABP8P3X7_9MICO